MENCAIWPISQAFAGEHIQTKSFSLAVPEVFEIVQARQSYVEAALRHRQGGFPTFNVLLIPSPAQGPKNPSDFAADTLESYKNMGLTGAAVEESGRRKIGVKEAFFARLRYWHGKNALQSIVIGIIMPENELILTFVDRAEDMQRDSPLLELILNSFEIAGSSGTNDEEASALVFRYSVVVAASCVVLFLAIFLTIRGRQSRKT